MKDVDLGKEVRNAPPAEPLLPIEKKLIVASLTLGMGLLIVLYFVTRALA